MKIILTITMIIVFLFCEGINSAQDCKSFRVGKFGIIVKDKVSYTILRNDSIQFEKSLETGVEMTFRVTWTSDCEYYLQIVKGTKEAEEFYDNKKLFVKIIDITGNSFKFSARLEGADKVMQSVMVKLE